VASLLLRINGTVSRFRNGIDFHTHAVERASNSGPYRGGGAHHFGIDSVEPLEIAHIRQIRLDADQSAEIGAGVFQHKTLVIEYGDGLLFDRFAENVPLGISRDLARHENQAAGPTPETVVTAPGRLFV
jgi:hypothetical protein